MSRYRNTRTAVCVRLCLPQVDRILERGSFISPMNCRYFLIYTEREDRSDIDAVKAREAFEEQSFSFRFIAAMASLYTSGKLRGACVHWLYRLGV